MASKTPPKSKKNRVKINVKKKLEKKSKKVPTRPTEETCLSKEREARRCIRAVKAFTSKGKQENARRSRGRQEKQGRGSKSKKRQQPKQKKTLSARKSEGQ